MDIPSAAAFCPVPISSRHWEFLLGIWTSTGSTSCLLISVSHLDVNCLKPTLIGFTTSPALGGGGGRAVMVFSTFSSLSESRIGSILSNSPQILSMRWSESLGRLVPLSVLLPVCGGIEGPAALALPTWVGDLTNNDGDEVSLMDVI